jgi:hypothetical protein
LLASKALSKDLPIVKSLVEHFHILSPLVKHFLRFVYHHARFVLVPGVHEVLFLVLLIFQSTWSKVCLPSLLLLLVFYDILGKVQVVGKIPFCSIKHNFIFLGVLLVFHMVHLQGNEFSVHLRDGGSSSIPGFLVQFNFV